MTLRYIIQTNQVSSLTPWTSPDITFRIIDSLSIKIVFCISDTVLINISHLVISFESSLIVFFSPPPTAIGITVQYHISWTSLPHLECELLVLCQLLYPFCFQVVLLRASHVTYPNMFFLLVFEHQIGSPNCCGFSEVKLKVPNQFGFSVLQDCSSLPVYDENF